MFESPLDTMTTALRLRPVRRAHLLWIAGVMLMARPALADRMAPPPWAKSSIDTVFLGTWRDFEGHPASYFFDVDGRRVLGPIEHALKPNITLAFRPGPPPAAAARRGNTKRVSDRPAGVGFGGPRRGDLTSTLAR